MYLIYMDGGEITSSPHLKREATGFPPMNKTVARLSIYNGGDSIVDSQSSVAVIDKQSVLFFHLFIHLMSTKKRLSNTTWVLGDTPCKTLKTKTGSWVDSQKPASKTGKVGKQRSTLFGYANRVN